MLLIHVPKLTNRLGYSLNVLFRHVLHADFGITTDAACYAAHADAKLCYGPAPLGGGLFLKSASLLFETSIVDQEPRPFRKEGQWRLFPVYGRDVALDFDPLAATFYMVSRYEEYLPHLEDAHGRFPASESLAARSGFVEEPVVDQWAMVLRDLISEHYPGYEWPRRQFRFEQTLDIDAAWAYLHKGLFRTVTGAARDLFARRDPQEVRRRFRVLAGREPDPYDTFDYIMQVRRRAPHSALYAFVLVADYGQHDKPASYLNPAFRDMLQHVGDHAHMGIHPGYDTLENPRLCDVETHRLEAILHHPISRARFHYLRLRLPQSYRILQHAGISHDYSMGFADALGFRAGVSVPFPFYDLERDQETDLTIHPFCFMDSAMRLHLGLDPQEAAARIQALFASLRAVEGVFSCVIHNQYLSGAGPWEGWRQTYEFMIDLANQPNV